MVLYNIITTIVKVFGHNPGGGGGAPETAPSVIYI